MALRGWLQVRPRGKHLRRALLVLLLAPLVFLGSEAYLRAKLDSGSVGVGATRVYARPPSLARGDVPDGERVREHLQRLGYAKAQGREVGIGEFHFGSRGWVIGQRPFRGPTERTQASFAIVRLDYSGRISRIEDEEGQRVQTVSLEPELIGRLTRESNQDRLPLPLGEIPRTLVDALLTVEDQKFFQHGGLDYRRIGAAFAANVRAGRVVQGGSTLTQQLVKNLFLSPKRSLVRKVREASMAMALEARYSKEEILQAYLNNVYLGQDGAVAIHGVGRAAQHFFGRDVTGLGLAESALLVALIRAPSLYSPLRHPDTARERRNLVLRLMRDAGAISDEDYGEATQAPLSLRVQSPPIRSARYFLDHLVTQLSSDDGEVAPYGGQAIISTLDSELQRAAERAVDEGLASLERDFDWLAQGEAGGRLQAALVAMDPHTGEILAMVGGRDYGTSQFNRATNARRQPGSAFKPIVAMAALARPRGEGEGMKDPSLPPFTLASVLVDEPLQVETRAGLWQPANYDLNFNGEVTLRDALERSLNVPFARLGLAVGPENIVRAARSMGIESPMGPYPSLALGASEVSPLELTRAFGVLAAEGYLAEEKSVLGQPTIRRQVYESSETYLVTSALRGAVERGTGQGIRRLGFQGDVAAKSGTTNDFRDGWFVGYTPSVVVAVWVGFDHGKALQLPGAGVALPIFADFLRNGLGPEGRMGPWGDGGFSLPSGLEIVDVDPLSGRRAGWGCRGEPELFLTGTAPQESCSRFGFDGRSFRVLLNRGGEEVSRLIRRILEGERRK